MTQLSCNLTGAFKEMKTGMGGKRLGSRRSSDLCNVLQNMECVESFPLGYGGFCLGSGFFTFFPVLSCF